MGREGLPQGLVIMKTSMNKSQTIQTITQYTGGSNKFRTSVKSHRGTSGCAQDGEIIRVFLVEVFMRSIIKAHVNVLRDRFNV